MLFSGSYICSAGDLPVYGCAHVYEHIKTDVKFFIEWTSEMEVGRILAV